MHGATLALLEIVEQGGQSVGIVSTVQYDIGSILQLLVTSTPLPVFQSPGEVMPFNLPSLVSK